MSVTGTAGDDDDMDGVPNETDLCAGSIAGGGQPDSFGCPQSFDRYAELSFDHEKHRIWYERFWTGDCGDLGFFDFCRSGEPYWSNTMANTVYMLPARKQGPLRQEMWALGRLVGHE